MTEVYNIPEREQFVLIGLGGCHGKRAPDPGLHEDRISRKQKGLPNLGHHHCDLSERVGGLLLKIPMERKRDGPTIGTLPIIDHTEI